MEKSEKKIEETYTNFICKQRWFSLQLPIKWTESTQDEGVYEFIDTTDWTGNFRVLPIRFHEWDTGAALCFLEETYENAHSKNAQKDKIGDMYCVSFKECIEMTELSTYYWFLQKNNFVFIFSYSTPVENEGTKENECELKEIKKIIASVKTIA